VRADGQEPDMRRQRRASGRRTAKPLSIKDAKRRSDGCARKAIELTPGDLPCVASATEAIERWSDRMAEVSRGRSRRVPFLPLKARMGEAPRLDDEGPKSRRRPPTAKNPVVFSDTTRSIEPPWYGPVCPVVWEESRGSPLSRSLANGCRPSRRVASDSNHDQRYSGPAWSVRSSYGGGIGWPGKCVSTRRCCSMRPYSGSARTSGI